MQPQRIPILLLPPTDEDRDGNATTFVFLHGVTTKNQFGTVSRTLVGRAATTTDKLETDFPQSQWECRKSSPRHAEEIGSPTSRDPLTR